MRTYAKITPEGTKDYLFGEVRARAVIRQALTDVFERYGYQPIVTPHLEFHDVFRLPAAEWLSENYYSVTDSRGRLLVMRPDSTLPIARVAATRLLRAALPLRLYYHQSVFRRARVYSGFSDEITQSGVELLGAGGLRADLEVLGCAAEALLGCEAPHFRMELGHAAIFRSLADGLNGAGEELREQLALAIETKNVPRLQELLEPFGGAAEARALLELPMLFGGAREVLARAKKLLREPEAARALQYLAELYEQCEQLGLGDSIDMDLGLVQHGRLYYTGLVFRGYIEGSGKRVLAGGRYDGLMAEFGRPAEAVGFALNLDALAEALLESGRAPQPPQAQTLVFAPAGSEAKALLRCRALRAQGTRCETAMCNTPQEAKDFAAARGMELELV
ncbi:MAG: ATP phosphoribosyltransferase regulatory subunit [Oscillospiraceae bacterium]|jgi:ATP phosphoribosyltransferase regulatory subunit|nr:ATP phosphoribosyltransferase regulatory subunit [Oscillospiraceae bacterium]